MFCLCFKKYQKGSECPFILIYILHSVPSLVGLGLHDSSFKDIVQCEKLTPFPGGPGGPWGPLKKRVKHVNQLKVDAKLRKHFLIIKKTTNQISFFSSQSHGSRAAL